MRKLVVIAAALIVSTTAAVAQSPIPGTGKILLFGTTEHLTGSPQNAVVRDFEVTHTVAGQDGPQPLPGEAAHLLHLRTTTARNRSRGRCRRTTKRSWR